MSIQPRLLADGIYTDERGIVSFVNEFIMDQVKRLYQIEHLDVNIVRAWQGHDVEQKWFYVSHGSYNIVTAQPDDWEQSSNKSILKQFILKAGTPEVLHIPGGYATGFKATEPNSKMIVFSDFTVRQSVNDDHRFDKSLWFDWETSNALITTA